MAYILPRAFIVLIGWGITCGLMVNLWPRVDATTFVIAGASWALAGIVCFGYIRRLRVEAED
ncbi:MAG TPA: hypothetical protein VGR45_13855 [Stellaceae bacterium]|nr:hypothetical protein [Stellaceae bacterium]